MIRNIKSFCRVRRHRWSYGVRSRNCTKCGCKQFKAYQHRARWVNY